MQQSGRLKLFLGYARGVGAVESMLQAAKREQDRGVDVVVSSLRKRAGLPPKLSRHFEEIPLRDQPPFPNNVDLEAVLARQPQLVLLDELHQRNLPPSRHRRRYQDVQELLDAGIDVYAVLYIQHLESLNDIVRQITGASFQQTVPDRLLDAADEIQLVDLPPEDLIARYEDGTIDTDMPEEEARRFYRLGNLYGLRELALRRAADYVDNQMRSYMQQQAIAGPWGAAERLMVCVSPSPISERLVRSARRLARDLDAEWFAVHVQTPDNDRLSVDERDRVWRTLQYAETLGGESITLTGNNVPERLIEYARQHNVTKIIVGKSLKPAWQDLFRGSLVDRLIHLSQNIDVYVISSADSTPSAQTTERRVRDVYWLHYLQAVLLVVGATLLSFPIDSFLSPTNLVMLYLVAVVIAASWLGRGPAVLTAFLSVLSFDYFFVPPRLTLVVADTEYLLTFAGLLVVGIVISTLVSQVRERTRTAQQRDEQTATLYALSRALAAAGNVEAIVQAVVQQVNQIFGREAVLFLPSGKGELDIYPSTTPVRLDQAERDVAEWVFRHSRPAGHGTDTMPGVDLRYVPLLTSRGVIGVLGVQPDQPEALLSPEQTRLLNAFSSQAALAVERATLAEQAQQAQILKATEQFQSALLNSISHDLRTPLVSITGVLSSLRDDDLALPARARHELVDTAYQEAERLNRLVGNLLHITRIEGGALRMNREQYDVEDLIGASLAALNEKLKAHEVIVQIGKDLPLVSMDFVLMNQVVINLVENAVKYSSPGSRITITALPGGAQVQLTVADEGVGIPESDLERVFEKFYRVESSSERAGTGLGLSISKGIVEAHGGQIYAANRPKGGTRIVITLPVEDNASSAMQASIVRSEDV